jgi:hypothetical protein
MKKKPFVFFICICLLALSCKEERVHPVNQLVKDLFCFKEGSTWTYYDSISQKPRTLAVVSYTETKWAPTPKCCGSHRKAYEFGESLQIDFLLEDVDKTWRVEGTTEMTGSYEKDNVLIDIDTYFACPLLNISGNKMQEFVFFCDENNVFSENVTFLPVFSVGDISYKEVYLFEKNDIKCYVAKNIGFLKCIDEDENLVLIDKNVIQ